MIFYLYVLNLVICIINPIYCIIFTWSKLVFILYIIQLLDKNSLKNEKHLKF